MRRRMRRQDSTCPDSREECKCPETAIIRCTCEFFACIDRNDRLTPILGIELDTGVGNPCLAFVVDTTGSMATEIEAAVSVAYR